MRKKRILISGINIQWPISELILSGQKSIETRTYPIPKKHIGVPIALIETPGLDGIFKARIRGIIKFDQSFEYRSKDDFYKDIKRHRVGPDSAWKWTSKRKKFGWPVSILTIFETPLDPPKKRGIVFAGNCDVSINA
jgi:hypothetical protein